MIKQKCIVLAVALALIGGTAGVLVRVRAHQRLGQPGIRTAPIPESKRLEIQLPELVLEYKSEAVPVDKNFLDYMPEDTSINQRRYLAADKFWLEMNVVLMGRDRTSIHKPEFCLTGQGWMIDEGKTVTGAIPMERPQRYELPVRIFEARHEFGPREQPETWKGIYIFWFVADHQLTASHWTRNWSMAKELLRSGTLQRWAYISCFAVCRPGQEEATRQRMEKFIQSAAPQFQLAPGPQQAEAATVQTASSQAR